MIKPLNKPAIATAMIFLTSLNSYAGDVDKTLAWVQGGEISVEITSGQIEFRGWDKDEVKLTGDFAGDEDRLTFKKSGSKIKLELDDHSGGWWGKNSGGNVDFTVYAPTSSHLDINGTSLNIDVRNISGNVEASSISGSVSLQGHSKRIDAETVSGDIDIKDASGKMRLRTVSGDISTDVNAITFEAKTVSGDISSQIGHTEMANVLSVSGDIDLELVLIKEGRLDGQTVSGDIDLKFKDKVNADFEINTGPGGNISNRLSDDRPKDNDSWGEELRFTIGDGSANVDLQTMSGTIKLR